MRVVRLVLTVLVWTVAGAAAFVGVVLVLCGLALAAAAWLV